MNPPLSTTHSPHPQSLTLNRLTSQLDLYSVVFLAGKAHGLRVIMYRHPSLAALGRNLRALRQERSLAQEKLAELAELDPTYISDTAWGVRNPSVLSLLRIARALGVTVARLVEGVEA